ncbi:hypothetical protein EV641_113165 [Rhodococcus sp. SMB37]|uniref:hypothetical protein n=1 Tax=Rhodococcus sp. SMB37 TaxID=2512213 RepID=UPI0006CFCB1C|nr:hypothetical protein [Rhodococcus sp. SMB37]TCN50184.1 hypothetical protein EV641_113165 [Rhodococcus sp. SMB37]
MSDADFAHTDRAEKNRRDKALGLARFAWHRGITGAELLAMTDDNRRRLARAADAHPPRSMETWTLVASLLCEKSAWAQTHPDHPSAARDHLDERIMWVKPPTRSWLD